MNFSFIASMINGHKCFCKSCIYYVHNRLITFIPLDREEQHQIHFFPAVLMVMGVNYERYTFASGTFHFIPLYLDSFVIIYE